MTNEGNQNQQPVYGNSASTPSTPADMPATSQARTWAMLSHLLGLAVFVPMGNIIGPLLVWHFKKDEYAFVEQHGKEAINFQILITMGIIIGVFTTVFVFGFFILLAMFFVDLVCVIQAAVKADQGVYYRYPVPFRFIR